jgi:predicted component of type VI protein secretion system
MKRVCLQLPLRTSKIMNKQDHPRCSIQESISQHLHLMITSRFYENKHDEQFGNELWENDFANITRNNLIKEQVKQSLLANILKYEKRLEQVRVDVGVSQQDIANRKNHSMKERVEIEVSAKMIKTKEAFTHREYFYVAPLSYY